MNNTCHYQSKSSQNKGNFSVFIIQFGKKRFSEKSKSLFVILLFIDFIFPSFFLFMFRRTIPLFFGAPPKKRVPGPPILHQSQRPAADYKIDFSQLGLSFPLNASRPTFTNPRIGWSAKPANINTSLPFTVDRVGEGENLPVYTETKGGGTKKITVIRKIRGDVIEFQKELRKVVDNTDIKIEMRPGKIIIHGNYHLRTKAWLVGLGL
jgi:hypothetical protein